MNLSKRLLAVADMITDGNRVADVGTDHGYIPIYLALHNRVPSAIAMDINKGPLKRAVDNIKQYGVEDIVSTRLSDGLKELKEGEADTVVIAGMGVILTNRILSEGIHVIKSVKELVLSPHSDVELVRSRLGALGFAIEDESMVLDEGKYYFIIKAVPKTPESYDELSLYFGRILLERKDITLKAYLEKENSKRDTILRKLDSVANRDRYEEILAEKERICRALELFE